MGISLQGSHYSSKILSALGFMKDRFSEDAVEALQLLTGDLRNVGSWVKANKLLKKCQGDPEQVVLKFLKLS